MKANIYISKILSLIIVLFVIISITFFLLRLLPGGPFDSEKKLPPQIKENIEKKYKLDQPLLKQYLYYIKDTLSGNFGMSYSYPDKSVKEIISDSYLISIKIGLISITFTLITTVILSCYMFNNKSRLCNLVKNILYLFVGVPTFLIGAILIILFSIKLDLINFGIINKPSDYLLPILTLSLPSISYLSNLLTESMEETKTTMFARIARINKIGKKEYLYKYILLNSIVPLVTAIGPISAFMITGSFVVESIFAIPGTGKLFVFSIINRDYTLICGLTIFYSVVLLLINSTIDLCYPLIDKRIKNENKN